MDTFLKMWPMILTLVGGIVESFSGQISAFYTAHPTAATIVTGVMMLLSSVSPPPHK